MSWPEDHTVVNQNALQTNPDNDRESPLIVTTKDETETDVGKKRTPYELTEDLQLAEQLARGLRVSECVLPGRSTDSIRARVGQLRKGRLHLMPGMTVHEKTMVNQILNIIHNPSMGYPYSSTRSYKFSELVTIFDAINSGKSLEDIVDLLRLERSPDSILSRLQTILKESIPFWPDMEPAAKVQANQLRLKMPNTDLLEKMASPPPRRPRDGQRFTAEDDEIVMHVFHEKGFSMTEGCRKTERNPLNLYHRFQKLRAAHGNEQLGDSVNHSQSEYDSERFEEGIYEPANQPTPITGRPWTQGEFQLLLKLRITDKLSWAEVSERLDRSEKSCSQKLQSYRHALESAVAEAHPASDEQDEAEEQDTQTTRPARAHQPWTSREHSLLIQLRYVERTRWEIIAERLGRTVPSVMNRYFRLKASGQLLEAVTARDGNDLTIANDDNDAQIEIGSGAAAGSGTQGEAGSSMAFTPVRMGASGSVEGETDPAVDATILDVDKDMDMDMDLYDDDPNVQDDDTDLEPRSTTTPARPSKWALWL